MLFLRLLAVFVFILQSLFDGASIFIILQIPEWMFFYQLMAFVKDEGAQEIGEKELHSG